MHDMVGAEEAITDMISPLSSLPALFPFPLRPPAARAPLRIQALENSVAFTVFMGATASNSKSKSTSTASWALPLQATLRWDAQAGIGCFWGVEMRYSNALSLGGQHVTLKRPRGRHQSAKHGSQSI